MMREDPRHAVRVIAGWLSTREAIWWGAICQSQLMSLGEAMLKRQLSDCRPQILSFCFLNNQNRGSVDDANPVRSFSLIWLV
jgi:hypothetical protein